jgi:hypothetical protein
MVIVRILQITRFSGLVVNLAVDTIHNPFGKDSAYGIIVRKVGVHPGRSAVHFAGRLI